MHIHNLYVDDAGETHFRDIEIDWVKEGPAGKMSATFPATGIIFRETPGSYDLDWHPAPRRQYIINLDAGVRVRRPSQKMRRGLERGAGVTITASDGETRVIDAGEVLLVEDTHGKGHLSKAIEGQLRHSIFVPIE